MLRLAFRTRALLFFYSTANLLGCTLALIGPALLFAGLISRGWLLITLALYALGLLLGRRTPDLEREIANSLGVEETLRHLDELATGAAPHLTPEMRANLQSIRDSVAEVLPRLLGQAPGGEDLFLVRETVLSYLPETLSNYAALPPAFRTTHPLSEGKTARQLMGEQLTLLEGKMREIVANVSASDAQALMANGQFLKQKFNRPSFVV